MTFPLRQTLDHYPWSPSTEDELGNPIDTWAETPTEVKVFGWSIGIVESLAGNVTASGSAWRATAEMFDAQVSAPVTWEPGLRDRVALQGDLFEVTSVRKQDSGFHGWQPGNVVLLKRVEGL